MRVERSSFLGVDPAAGSGRSPHRPQHSQPSANDEFSSTAASLVALMLSTNGVSPAVAPARTEIVARLKEAYENGAIRPDAARIAAAILRNSAYLAGGAGE